MGALMKLVPLPYRLVAMVLLAIALAVGGYVFGRHVMAGEVAEQQLEDALAYADLVREAQGRADALAADLARAETVQKPKDRIIIKEVIRYESIVPADRRCDLDGAWRVLHDASATGEPADTARLAAGSADPVTDAAALETVAENYADCREDKRKLSGWQKFWEDVSRRLQQ